MHLQRMIGIGAAFALAFVSEAATAKFLWFGKKKVERVEISRDPAAAPLELRPAPPATGRDRCIAMNGVAGAVVFGNRSVELSMKNGSRWRVHFAQECPSLSFYAGFYYRRAEAGRLCAGRDMVISRSGGECPIVSIVPIGALRRHR